MNRSTRDRHEGGFTLIELLIVIVILGILAGIVSFGVGTFRDDAKASCTATNAKLVATATSAWQAKNGPTTPSVAQLVNDKYLESAPGAC